MSQHSYLETKRAANLPHLPLEGSIDLTYRCNNNCRHCWLRIPADAPEREQEFSFAQIRKIAAEAKAMGCRSWAISGGEPMLREDFPEIFDCLTSNATTYFLNTNGTLITPKIAQLMKRKGSKMVALYGATADVHDYVTRNSGSFEATMQGFAYLKEAGAGFTVQIIPMRDNYHQLGAMIALAESLSRHYRFGAPWLHFCASGDEQKNAEIELQRLSPKEVVALDKPDVSYKEQDFKAEDSVCQQGTGNGHLLSGCISTKSAFHIDAYGKMTFCCFVKDPALRYDLGKGSFKEGWEAFIPSLAHKLKVTQEYKENCAACDLRRDCRCCPVYGYLEHRRLGAKVDYLCAVAKSTREFKEDWEKNHRRFFNIAEITIQVDSDLPITDTTFQPKFQYFATTTPGKDVIALRHHFSLPEIEGKNLGREVYRKPPWAIYQNGDSWVYLGISPIETDKQLYRIVTANANHTRLTIYNDKAENFLKGSLHSLTLFPTDQILLARILADRQGCYLHSCGVIFRGKGLLFAGHSEAGKSTLATILKGKAEILCDDRIIIRDSASGFKIYGTWSHGDVPDVSANSAPLEAIMFLKKAGRNRLIRLEDKKEIVRMILACLIRPFITAEWWEKTLVFIENLSREIPCYVLEFDKSGGVIKALEEL